MERSVNPRQRLLRGIACGLVGTILACVVWGPGWLETWEANTWDWRVALLAKPAKTSDDIRVILLDQESLDWAEKEQGLPWPWPRQLYGAIIDYCRRSGVKALAFDVLFTEFSRYGVDDDTAFGTAIKAFPAFVGTIFLGDDTGDQESWPEDFPAPGMTISGLNEWLKAAKADDMTFRRATMPIAEVAQNAALLCNVQHKPDFDGIYRRIKLFAVFDNKIFPTLGLGTYLAAQQNIQMQIFSGEFSVGTQTIPIDSNGNAILRYRGPGGTHTFYTAAEIVNAEIRHLSGEEPTEKDIAISEDLKDTYVLFGFSAPGLKDLRSAPIGGVYSGVEINVTVLDNLLSGDFIDDVPLWLILPLVLFLTLTLGILASFFSKPLHNMIFGIVFLTIPILLALGLYVKGFWLPVFIQEVALAMTLLASLVLNYATEGRQKRFLKGAFKQYLSPAVIEQLIQHPDQLKLGGEKRVLSIFFSDIQGFTSMSEKLNPEELTALLNEYLSAMTDIIHEEHGTIDKYEGDAIIAFWNAPLNVPEHAVRVVRAALRCQQSLAELRPVFKERIGGKEMFMRIGVNTGPAVVGNMGSHTRFDYTMLGDAVNLAARLEGVNKQFGTYTMISQSTLDLLGDAFAVRELARVAVVGRKEPITVYEPMLHEEYQAGQELFETFVEGLYLFYGGHFIEAREIFISIQNLDPPAAAYAEKCQGLIETPPAGWQGVWVMTTK